MFGEKLPQAGANDRVVIDDSDPDQSKITVSVAGDPALQNVEMHYQMSANGEKAGNGKLVWWTKGDEGMLAPLKPGEDVASAPGVTCVPPARAAAPSGPSRSPWTTAASGH